MGNSKKIHISSNAQNSVEGQAGHALVDMMNQLKIEVSIGRKLSIQEKIKQSRIVKEAIVSGLITKAASGKDTSFTEEGSVDKFDARIANPLLFFNCLTGSGTTNVIGKDVSASAVKMPNIQSIPPYTSWITIRKNKKMVEDQTIAGRRSIYYNPKGQGGKERYSEEDDRVIRKVLHEFELNEEVLLNLTRIVGGTTVEIQERCNYLKEMDENEEKQDSKLAEEFGSLRLMPLEKSLDEASKAFDYVFCRRCNVFDCCVHGVGQDIVYPIEKQPYSPDPESDGGKRPCSKNCYLQSILSTPQLEAIQHPEECHSVEPLHSESSKKRKTSRADGVHASSCRKRKPIAGLPGEYPKQAENVEREGEGATNNVIGLKKHPNGNGGSLSGTNDWKPLEKDLLSKGIEIFGRNSCFIARNLLSGLKTCFEVFNYMNVEGMPRGSNANTGSCADDQGENGEERTGNDSTVQTKKGVIPKEAKSKEHKQLSKQASETRIEGGKKIAKQYVPCICIGGCGHNCSCRLNGTSCEKYCGCSRICKNRFKGCQCTKSQCKSRHCPCFASERECDPDICKNCWISCGDGSQRDPSGKPETLCENMKLLLRQRKGILLGRSDVAGWGAFVKTSVNKHEFLGEYLGEVITQTEADNRGSIYDNINRSYLFNLNDQFVIDAYHFGNKLKFANHSPNPNCQAKVMLVNGDHRIAIFAARNLEAGEEILYDYGYGPEFVHDWAKKPKQKKKVAQLVRKTGEGSSSKVPCTTKRGGNV